MYKFNLYVTANWPTFASYWYTGGAIASITMGQKVKLSDVSFP